MSSIVDLKSDEGVKAANGLTLIKHEIERENTFNPDIKFENVELLTPELITQETLISLREHLEKLARYYVKQRNAVDAEKDRIIATKVKTPEERDAFNMMRDDYYNESLGDLVMNSTDFYRIIERDGKLIQRLHPVYQDPVGSSILRSQFFAPRKVLFGHYIDTYWANLLVIWSMSIFLMLTLYFDALSKLLEFLGSLGERLPRFQKS